MATIPLLLRTVFEAILQVFLLCFAGYLLARIRILDKKTQKQVNRLNVSLFTPALLFSKVAFSLSPSKLRELWMIPLIFAVVTAVSMGVSFLLGCAFRLKRPQRNFAMAASMFMNSNSLPIALMQSLVGSVSALKWGDSDTTSAMLGRALSYLVLYSTLGMVLRWSYGVRLLSKADSEEAESQQQDAQVHDEEKQVEKDKAPQRSHVLSPRSAAFLSFPNTPMHSTVNLPEVPVPAYAGTSYDQEATLPGSAPTSQQHSIWRRLLQRVMNFWRGFNEFMTAPLWASLLSVIVALIQPLQRVLNDAQPLKDALTSAGDCSIPLTLVVLGAYFYTPPPAEKEDVSVAPMDGIPLGSVAGRADGRWRAFVGSVRSIFHFRKSARSGESVSQMKVPRPGETRTVIIAVTSRMILTPMLLLPLMLLWHSHDFPRVFKDPVFIVSNVLLISSPPALTLAQLTQAASSSDAFEQLISRTIFWAYCIVTPPATIIYVVIGLLLAKP